MKICVISQDARFARMIELELKGVFGEVKTVTQTVNPMALKLETDNCDLVIFDSDSFGGDMSVVGDIKKQAVILSYKELTDVPENVKCVIKRPFLPEELSSVVGECASSFTDAEFDIKLKAVENIELDHYSKQARIGDMTVKFSPKEFSLLCLLYKNYGKVVSRKVVLDTLWGKDYDENNNVDNVYINYLRKKLDEPLGIKLIHTVRNQGYMLSLPQRSKE